MSTANIERKLEMAKYILDNKCGYKQAGEHFGIEGSGICMHMKYFKRTNPQLWNQIKETVDKSAREALISSRTKVSEEDKLAIINYIIDNKCTYRDAGKHFNVTDVTIKKHINYFKGTEIYEEAIKLAKEACKEARRAGSIRGGEVTQEAARKKREQYSMIKSKYVQNKIADWIIENDKSFQEAAKEFEMSISTISRCMQELKNRDEEKYEKAFKTAIGKHPYNRNEEEGIGYIRSIGELEVEEFDALKTYKKILWFKENLKVGDTVKYMVRGGKELKVDVTGVYKNYFTSNKISCCYYANCTKKIVTKKVV